MFQNRVQLTPQEILDKDFKVDVRGFNPKEVDQFLDVIIGDYEEFIKIIKEKDTEVSELQEEIMNLKAEIRSLKTNLDIAKSGEKREVTNLDILKRLSQLEKTVYGDRENNDN